MLRIWILILTSYLLKHDAADHLSSIARSYANTNHGKGGEIKTLLQAESLGKKDIAWLENSETVNDANKDKSSSPIKLSNTLSWQSIEVVGNEMRDNRKERNQQRKKIIEKFLGDSDSSWYKSVEWQRQRLAQQLLLQTRWTLVECGKEGGGVVSLKMCKSCMNARYCSAECQKNHWPTHKAACKYVSPSYAMCLCSRSRPWRRTVRFASYQCQINWYLVSHFHLRLYQHCLFMILHRQTRNWKNIIADCLWVGSKVVGSELLASKKWF